MFCYGEYSYYRLTKNIKEQINWLTSEKKLNACRAIIKQKVTNQYNLLKYIDLDKYQNQLKQIENYILKIDDCLYEELLNLEAISARVYFQALYGIEFNRREDCEINYALNYGYAILRSRIKASIISKGLHPSIGLFHYSQFNNYNLADDIIEVFRGIVDYAVYYQMEFDNQFTKEERQKLQQVVLQQVEINGMSSNFKNALEQFIQSVIGYFKGENELVVPKLLIELYEY